MWTEVDKKESFPQVTNKGETLSLEFMFSFPHYPQALLLLLFKLIYIIK